MYLLNSKIKGKVLNEILSYIDAQAISVHFARTADCPYYFTCFNEFGDACDESDPFIAIFDGENRLLSFSTDDETLLGTTRTYTLCANSSWNGTRACLDLVFNIVEQSIYTKEKIWRNNGFGNGDQEAPGGSEPHNNAENDITP